MVASCLLYLAGLHFVLIEPTLRAVDKMSSPPNPEQSDAEQLEAAADQAIAACGGDAREAVKALIIANRFLETELEKLRASVSMGYCERQAAGA